MYTSYTENGCLCLQSNAFSLHTHRHIQKVKPGNIRVHFCIILHPVLKMIMRVGKSKAREKIEKERRSERKLAYMSFWLGLSTEKTAKMTVK